MLRSDRVKARSGNKKHALKSISKDSFVKTAHSCLFIYLAFCASGKELAAENNLPVNTARIFFFLKDYLHIQ